MSNLIYKPMDTVPLNIDYGNMFNLSSNSSKTSTNPMEDWPGGGIGFNSKYGLTSGSDLKIPEVSDENWLQGIGFLGGKKGAGWGGLALGALQGGANLFMGMKQYGMAKDALNQAKEQYNRNYAAQKQTTNASLEDRQRARIASSPNAYVSVDEYMAQNGIK